MKYYFSVLLSFVLLISTSVGFISCGDDEEEIIPATSDKSSSTSESQTTSSDSEVAPPDEEDPDEENTDEETFTVNGVSFVMVPVEGGTFQMGSTEYSDEKPVHKVTLSSYSIGQTEVTQALWSAVMLSNPSYFKGYNLPVEEVSWNDCQTFINMLNQLTGKKFRLPTEAEWEYAARGGKHSKGYIYSGSYTLSGVAWFEDNSSRKTHPVATKRANELGLYDMCGNVVEWCQDWYGSYNSFALINPTGAPSGKFHVYRGGSWGDNAWSCRVSRRGNSWSSFTSWGIGFRLAL